MRIVRAPADVAQAFRAAQAEAAAAFGVPDVYVERYVEGPRHIEIQVMADSKGSVVHLGERECSIQRRHQKLVEEAPSAALSAELRERLCEVGVQAMKRIGYHNVGTLEFLLEPARGQVYFMEMNTRVQVEHTVTEEVTGVDIVREQILIAAGQKLSFQAPLQPRGHAIEVRINAEHPETFAPSPGKITALHIPGGLGVRVDTHIYSQYVVPPNYDSLLAKLIVHGPTRPAAIARLKRALGEFVVEGIHTNLAFHRRLVEHPEYIAGNIDTGFLERMGETPTRA